jgi:hypothetical protein
MPEQDTKSQKEEFGNIFGRKERNEEQNEEDLHDIRYQKKIKLNKIWWLTMPYLHDAVGFRQIKMLKHISRWNVLPVKAHFTFAFFRANQLLDLEDRELAASSPLHTYRLNHPIQSCLPVVGRPDLSPTKRETFPSLWQPSSLLFS